MSDLPFPKSLPDFQRLFPDDAACAKYVEAIRFRTGFVCPHYPFNSFRSLLGIAADSEAHTYAELYGAPSHTGQVGYSASTG